MKLPSVSDNLFRGEAEIIENRPVSPRYHLMTCRFPATSFPVEPGQFAHLRVTSGVDPLLRRPFSYHDIKQINGAVEAQFLYARVGKGTRLMVNLSKGDPIWKMGPLGNRFSLPDPEQTPVLIGGGVGVPPIHMLAQKLDRQQNLQPVHVLIGARSENEVLCEDRFRNYDIQFHVSTDDGSRGFHGYVTELFEKLYEEGTFPTPLRIYGCGPHGMLEAVRQQAEKHEVPAEIAIERQMGCALGICRACVVKVRGDSNDRARVATVCREGPVFNAHKLVSDWQDA